MLLYHYMYSIYRYHAQADSHQSLDLQLGNTYTLSHRRDLEEGLS